MLNGMGGGCGKVTGCGKVVCLVMGTLGSYRISGGISPSHLNLMCSCTNSSSGLASLFFNRWRRELASGLEMHSVRLMDSSMWQQLSMKPTSDNICFSLDLSRFVIDFLSAGKYQGNMQFLLMASISAAALSCSSKANLSRTTLSSIWQMQNSVQQSRRRMRWLRGVWFQRMQSLLMRVILVRSSVVKMRLLRKRRKHCPSACHEMVCKAVSASQIQVRKYPLLKISQLDNSLQSLLRRASPKQVWTRSSTAWKQEWRAWRMTSWGVGSGGALPSAGDWLFMTFNYPPFPTLFAAAPKFTFINDLHIHHTNGQSTLGLSDTPSLVLVHAKYWQALFMLRCRFDVDLWDNISICDITCWLLINTG